MSALSDIVAKFRKASPNIAAAFDEVERRLVAVEGSVNRAWTELAEHETRLAALEQTDPPPPDPDPDPPPVSQFGSELPARNVASTGPVMSVSSLSGLNPAPGTIVRLTNGFTISGLSIGWKGTADAPITIDLGGYPFPGGQFLLMNAAYLNIRNGSRPNASDGFKIEGDTHHIDVENVNFDAAKNMAFNVQGPACHHLQFWRCKITNGGDASPTLNQDHGFYMNGVNDWVIGSCLVENQLAFAGQAYPNSHRGIVTGCTARGRKSNSVAGGWYLGDGAGSSDHRMVGLVVEDSSEIAIWNNGQNNQAFDCIARRTASTPFLGGGFTHCVASDTQTVKDFVQPARYGLLPATFRDGTARTTADAGSEKV